jgi:hypothetical protein
VSGNPRGLASASSPANKVLTKKGQTNTRTTAPSKFIPTNALEAQLYAFYAQYNPEKCSTVVGTARKWQGKEEQLMKLIHQ